jgi:hypothetical protein
MFNVRIETHIKLIQLIFLAAVVALLLRMIDENSFAFGFGLSYIHSCFLDYSNNFFPSTYYTN